MSTEEQGKNKISRRDFIRAAAVGGAALASSVTLAGCTTAEATPAATPEAQVCPPAGVPATWDYEADVVIVGLGGAGASAAIEAHDQGANVLVVEKLPEATHYPNSRMCGGVFHNPDPTGDKAALIEYLKACMSGENIPWKLEGEQPHVSQKLAEVVADYMLQDAEWMLSLDPDLDKEAMAPGGDSSFPMFPGFAEAKYGRTVSFRYPEYGDADPAVPIYDRPKMQKSAGESWYHALVKVGMASRNIQVLWETPATKLIQREDGEILGVMANAGGKAIAIKAKKAVIMTAGGYEYDVAMRRAFLEGPGVTGWGFYGSPDNRGDGIRMAIAVGAGLAKVGKAASRIEPAVPAGRGYEETGLKMGLSGNVRQPNSIVVDNYGNRYTDEYVIVDSTRPYRYQFYKEAVKYDMYHMIYPRVPSWHIFDETFRSTYNAAGGGPVNFSFVSWPTDNLEAIANGWVLKADTLEELVAKINADRENRNLMDADTLVQTVEKYNTFCAGGEDLDFNRNPDTMGPVETPPFYALKLYPGGPNTKGGIDADYTRRVLDWQGKPMARLFTAGEISSIFKFTYQAGGNVTECMACGRIAGKNAAALTAWDEA
jgi:3-oxosteroid 1-dehydrogenase